MTSERRVITVTHGVNKVVRIDEQVHEQPRFHTSERRCIARVDTDTDIPYTDRHCVST